MEEENVVIEQQPVETQNVAPSIQQPVESPKKKNTALIIILAVVGGIIILTVAILAIVLLLFSSEKKLVCTAKEGSITINYDDKTIKSYAATGALTYDFDEQRGIAERIGTDEYMKEFEKWFKSNTSGSCVYK